MSIAAPLLFEKASPDHSTVECRVYQRHACELPTSCQPASVQEMRETRWSATICDISQGGLGLHLERRYEKGAALAVELPGDADHPPSVVFVRVVHVKRDDDGMWRLGCKFISELSDDDVHRLLNVEPHEVDPEQPIDSQKPIPSAAPQNHGANQRKTVYANVRVEIEDRSGATFRMTIKQLHVGNNQAVTPGQQLKIVGGISQGKSWVFQIEVDHLEQVENQWKLRGFLVQPTAVAELVQFIKLSKKPG
jgi:hypothetical protein